MATVKMVKEITDEDHIVVIPGGKLNTKLLDSIRWLKQPEIAGHVKWLHYSLIRENGKWRKRDYDKDPIETIKDTHTWFAFTDANAAFEFKMRWA